jgi:hypothetical protein
MILASAVDVTIQVRVTSGVTSGAFSGTSSNVMQCPQLGQKSAAGMTWVSSWLMGFVGIGLILSSDVHASPVPHGRRISSRDASFSDARLS